MPKINVKDTCKTTNRTLNKTLAKCRPTKPKITKAMMTMKGIIMMTMMAMVMVLVVFVASFFPHN